MRRSRLVRLLMMLGGAALLAIGVREFVALPRAVPSESMMPALLPGDVFLALRWPYGSPLAARLSERRPARGEIVVITTDHGDVVKRVIGLPGDRIALRAGAVMLNGRPLPRYRVADALLAPSRASPCQPTARTAGVTTRLCRIAVWRERLGSSRSWDTLDRGTNALDDMPEQRVPAGHLFLLGDNRDRSADSRLDVAGGGIGMVPIGAVSGRAWLILWSSDGSATLLHPSTWLRALRVDRILSFPNRTVLILSGM